MVRIQPIIELPMRIPLAYNKARWSRSPGCYQLKAALAWYELGQIAKQDCYFELYKALLRSSSIRTIHLRGCDYRDPRHGQSACYCIPRRAAAVVNDPMANESCVSRLERKSAL